MEQASPPPPSLRERLNRRHQEVSAFLEANPELAEIIGAALSVVETLARGSTLRYGSESLAKTHCGVMWQTAADYHGQALIHILARELDVGFALVRMAVELSRDAYVLGHNQNLLDLWNDREERSVEYRKNFRFDCSIDAGKVGYELYKLCSRFGVHGHMTSIIHAGPIGSTVASGNGVIIDTDDRAIFSGLRIWLRSIFAVHKLFCEAFRLSKESDEQLYGNFMDFLASLEPIIEAVDGAVRDGMRRSAESPTAIVSE